MMIEKDFEIERNVRIAEETYEMTFLGDFRISAPGQFINIKVPGFFLRRPISVAYHDDDHLTIVYKTPGQGTKTMSWMKPGEKLNILTPLGNGYDLDLIPDAPLIAGGGAGIPPMYGLARALAGSGKKPSAVLGFNSEKDQFYIEKFRELGIDVKVKTGGYITDIMESGRYVCCCGPTPMLKAVYDIAGDGQFSFESRMGCGFGACMGCSIKTKDGQKRVCKDGPVFKKEEILW